MNALDRVLFILLVLLVGVMVVGVVVGVWLLWSLYREVVGVRSAFWG